jgi:hypothetical protein
VVLDPAGANIPLNLIAAADTTATRTFAYYVGGIAPTGGLTIRATWSSATRRAAESQAFADAMTATPTAVRGQVATRGESQMPAPGALAATPRPAARHSGAEINPAVRGVHVVRERLCTIPKKVNGDHPHERPSAEASRGA